MVAKARQKTVKDGERTISMICRPNMVNLRLGVKGPNCILVSGPEHCSFNTLWSFYKRHELVVASELQAVKAASLLPECLSDDTVLSLFGRLLPVVFRYGSSNCMRLAGDRIEWETDGLSRTAALTAYKKLLIDTLATYTKKRLQQMMPSKIPVTFRIKLYKAKWGLCRPDRCEISLNLILAALPSHLTDYVLAHELAHLDVADHSACFYRRLAALDPNWCERRAELRRHRRVFLG